MNFLAHIHLAHPDPKLMLGGLLGDSTRRKDFTHLPPEIIRGVEMHWFIDEFTDQHPTVKNASAIFKPLQEKFAPVVLDIVFDHFLAANWDNYSTIPLDVFAHNFYALCRENKSLLNAKTTRLMFYMERDNWLFHYRNIPGIQKALSGISHKSTFANKMDVATATLKENYPQLESLFFAFYPALQKAVEDWKGVN
ncbi:MAG: DUF479 domain-containing protein [Cryomorphaceae bacterium]|nr:DUF479 domain-containing protein [Cryomorphaceae bacterium]